MSLPKKTKVYKKHPRAQTRGQMLRGVAHAMKRIGATKIRKNPRRRA